MILQFSDHEGDPIAVESAEIVGLSVGDVNGPQRDAQAVRVTLVWTRGVGQPFMVAAPFDHVLATWQTARLEPGPHGETLAEMRAAHSGVFPLVAHQYPDGPPT